MGASSDLCVQLQGSSAIETNKQTQFLSLRILQVVPLAFDKHPNTSELSFSTSARREETRAQPMSMLVPIKVLPGFHKSIDVIP